MADFSETYRGDVEAWECDAFGHMNIAFYAERFGDAAASLLAPLGAGRAFRTVSLFTRYRTELQAGESVDVRSGVLGTAESAAKGDRVVRLGHELRRSGDGKVTTEVEHALAPREARMRAGLKKTLEAATAVWAAEPFKPVAIPAASGSHPCLRDRVKNWEVDEIGQLSLAGYVRRFSSANTQMMNAIGMSAEYIHAAKRGFATFETRLALTPFQPGAGAEVTVACSFTKIGNSSATMIQDMFDVRRGERIARFWQAGVHFDLEKRRSAPFDDAMRAKAAGLMLATS